jgi:diacylglycerol kinase (ATP)
MIGKLVLIVNPISGGGLPLRHLPELEKQLQDKHLSYSVHHTTHPGHAEELARFFSNEASIIIAVGGDGTVNEVMKGVLGTPSVLGIIPCGSGNDIAGSFHISMSNALSIITEGVAQAVDVAMVNNQPFLGVASCGLDTEVNRMANRIPRFLKGPLLYTLAMVLALVKYKAIKMIIKTPHAVFEEEIMLMAIGHGDRYGGGMKITPKARRDDGLLDFCMVKKISKWELLFVFPKVFSGRHLDHPKVNYFQIPYLSVEGQGDIFADGDFKTTLPANYELHPCMLQMMLPDSLVQPVFSK